MSQICGDERRKKRSSLWEDQLRRAPPPDKTLTQDGVAADAATVGSVVSGLKTNKETIDGWNCLTLECGIKIAYYHGDYGSTSITNAEGALFYANFSKNLPSGFFTLFPTVLTQCELNNGYGLYITLSSNSNKNTLTGWFFTDISCTGNPYVHIVCIGV